MEIGGKKSPDKNRKPFSNKTKDYKSRFRTKKRCRMSFNGMNTIENALRNHIAGRPNSESINVVAEDSAEFIVGGNYEN